MAKFSSVIRLWIHIIFSMLNFALHRPWGMHIWMYFHIQHSVVVMPPTVAEKKFNLCTTKKYYQLFSNSLFCFATNNVKWLVEIFNDFHLFFNERSNTVNHQRYQSMSLTDLWPDKYKTILIWKCRHNKFLHWHIWPAVLQFLSQFTTVLSGNLTGHWLHRGITGNKTRSHRYRDRCKMAAGK